MCERLKHSSSVHLSFLSTSLQPSIHLSVHSSLHPLVHITFVPRVDPSVMACVMPVLSYIDISIQTSTFFKLLEIHNFSADAVLKKMAGGRKAFDRFFLVANRYWDKNIATKVYDPYNSFHHIGSILWHSEYHL